MYYDSQVCELNRVCTAPRYGWVHQEMEAGSVSVFLYSKLGPEAAFSKPIKTALHCF